MAARFKLEPSVIAKALKLTTARIESLLETRTATAKLTGRYAYSESPDSGPVPLKRTIRHMAGERLTKPQQEANQKLSGMAPAFYVNQLILLLENGLMPGDDENLESRLRILFELLESRVAAA